MLVLSMLSSLNLLSRIEYEIVLYLIYKSRDQELKEEQCTEIARKVLNLFPEDIKEEKFYQALFQLKEIHSGLSQVADKYINYINSLGNQQVN